MCYSSFIYDLNFIFASSVGAIKNIGENVNEGEWLELVALTFVELVLELNPMETKGMQEALEQIHAHEDGEGDGPEDWPKDNSL